MRFEPQRSAAIRSDAAGTTNPLFFFPLRTLDPGYNEGAESMPLRVPANGSLHYLNHILPVLPLYYDRDTHHNGVHHSDSANCAPSPTTNFYILRTVTISMFCSSSDVGCSRMSAAPGEQTQPIITHPWRIHPQQLLTTPARAPDVLLLLCFVRAFRDRIRACKRL